MSNTYTIGEVAEKTGLNKKTVRYYEEVGLIRSVNRSENNYRYYTVNNIQELTLIKKVRDLGLPINEIKKLLIGCGKENCTYHKEDLARDIKQYSATIDQKINDLKLLKLQLNKLHRDVISGESFSSDNQHCCNLLKQLSQIPEGGDY
jgi:DNA-binding transcriptional MerR regulator